MNIIALVGRSGEPNIFQKEDEVGAFTKTNFEVVVK